MILCLAALLSTILLSAFLRREHLKNATTQYQRSSYKGTRFVGKPEGVSNVFLTNFDYFFEGSLQNWGLRGTKGGLNPQSPKKSSTCGMTEILENKRILLLLLYTTKGSCTYYIYAKIGHFWPPPPYITQYNISGNHPQYYKTIATPAPNPNFCHLLITKRLKLFNFCDFWQFLQFLWSMNNWN